MTYDFKGDTLKCPNCGNTDNPDIEYDNKENFDLCPICGGQLNLGKYGSAVKCGYCDSYVVSDTRLGGDNTPYRIIPTTITKKEMFELLTKKFGKYLCIIPEIFSQSRLKEVIIEYVPYWVYRFGVRAVYNGVVKESVTTGNTTVTDTYNVSETWDLDMGNVPVDASDRMPDEILDALEPFDFKKGLDFKPEYLSGSNSELFNHDSDFYKEEASYKVCDCVYEFIDDRIHEKFPHAVNITDKKLRDETIINMRTLDRDYYLLPVYRYSYTFEDGKVLDYYVNGQTKEIYGTAPISKKRLWGAIAAIVTAFAGGAALITTFLMLIGGAV